MVSKNTKLIAAALLTVGGAYLAYTTFDPTQKTAGTVGSGVGIGLLLAAFL